MGERIINPVHNVFKKYRKMNLVNPYWFQKPFVSTWRTSNIFAGSSTNVQVKLPLVSIGSYNFLVNWGDGSSDTITSWNQAQTTHTYSISGDYIIKISGTCIGWSFNNTGDRLKILSVSTWGPIKFAFTSGAFYGCVNLNLTNVMDLPDLTGGNLANAFQGCTTITTINRLDQWNMSLVTTLSNTFALASNFNQNIGAWDVSNVLSMNSTFNGCFQFRNGNSSTINNWNTSQVTNMNLLFQNCTNFNQPIGSWNVSNVTVMSGLFFNALLFNQNLGSWNVSNVTNFLSMFEQCQAFNNGGSSTINNWVLNTSVPITIASLFKGCTVFNQPLNLWNTSRATTTNATFNNANAFNQNIGSWSMNNVTNMNSMFNGCMAFNNGGSSTINNWVLSNVTGMQSVFQNCTNFNQPIGSWNVSNVTNFSNFMNGKTAANYLAANLDLIYNTTTGWASRPVKPSIVITFGTIKYTAAGSAGRAILTGAPNLWTITDGGI